MAGNWKMFKTPAETSAFFDGLKPLVADATHCEIVICPPFIDVTAAVEGVKGTRIEIGGQNVFWEKEGAYTAETAPGMLTAAGCRWVIIGHSERRQYFGEAGQTEEVLVGQFRGGIAGLTPEQFSKITIAYEPVWAIGTGKTATPEIAADAHKVLRAQVAGKFGPEAAGAVRILYGGSVKPANVNELMAKDEIDGALVGGASLKPDSFAGIVNYKT